MKCSSKYTKFYFVKKILSLSLSFFLFIESPLLNASSSINESFKMPASSRGLSIETLLNPISRDRVEVRETLSGQENARSPHILIMEEAHASADAQEALYEAAVLLRDSGLIDAAGFEGAWGSLDPYFFRTAPSAAWMEQKILTGIRQGEISGPAAAFALGSQPVRMFGGEDENLYRISVNAYLEASNRAPVLLQELDKIRARFLEAEEKSLTAAARETLEILDAFVQNGFSEPVFQSLETRLPESFIKVRARDFPQIDLFAGILLENAGGDENPLSAEWQSFKENLEQSLHSTQELAVLEGWWQAFRSGQMDDFQMAEFFEKEAVRCGLVLPLKIQEKAGIARKFRTLEGYRFAEEWNLYPEAAARVLLKSETEKNFFRVRRFLGRLQKAIRLELDRESWDEMKTGAFFHDSAFKGLPGIQALQKQTALWASEEAFWRYYESAEAREESFLKRTVEETRSAPTSVSVFVTGGFHREALKRLFHSAGFRVTVLSPRFTLSSHESETYRERMRGNVSWKDSYKPSQGRLAVGRDFARSLLRDFQKETAEAETRRVFLRRWEENFLRQPVSSENKSRVQNLFHENRLDESSERLVDKTGSFLNSLETLRREERLNGASVSALTARSLTVPWNAVSIFNLDAEVPESWAQGRPELRSLRDPQFPYKKMRTLSLAKDETRHPYHPASYDGVFHLATQFENPGLTPFSDLIESRIKKSEGKLVWADIGPGYGYALRDARKKFGQEKLKIYGVDLVNWRTALDPTTHARMELADDDYVFLESPMEEVVFPEPPHLISGFYSIPYTPDPLYAFEHLYNQLAVGGEMVFSYFPYLIPADQDAEELEKIPEYRRVNVDWMTVLLAVLQEEGILSGYTKAGVFYLKKLTAELIHINLEPISQSRSADDQVHVRYKRRVSGEPLVEIFESPSQDSSPRLLNLDLGLSKLKTPGTGFPQNRAELRVISSGSSFDNDPSKTAFPKPEDSQGFDYWRWEAGRDLTGSEDSVHATLFKQMISRYAQIMGMLPEQILDENKRWLNVGVESEIVILPFEPYYTDAIREHNLVEAFRRFNPKIHIDGVSPIVERQANYQNREGYISGTAQDLTAAAKDGFYDYSVFIGLSAEEYFDVVHAVKNGFETRYDLYYSWALEQRRVLKDGGTVLASFGLYPNPDFLAAFQDAGFEAVRLGQPEFFYAFKKSGSDPLKRFSRSELRLEETDGERVQRKSLGRGYDRAVSDKLFKRSISLLRRARRDQRNGEAGYAELEDAAFKLRRAAALMTRLRSRRLPAEIQEKKHSLLRSIQTTLASNALKYGVLLRRERDYEKARASFMEALRLTRAIQESDKTDKIALKLQAYILRELGFLNVSQGRFLYEEDLQEQLEFYEKAAVFFAESLLIMETPALFEQDAQVPELRRDHEGVIKRIKVLRRTIRQRFTQGSTLEFRLMSGDLENDEPFFVSGQKAPYRVARRGEKFELLNNDSFLNRFAREEGLFQWDERNDVLLVYRGGELIAGWMFQADPQRLHVRDRGFYIHPAYRNFGVENLLESRLLAMFKNQGYQTFEAAFDYPESEEEIETVRETHIFYQKFLRRSKPALKGRVSRSPDGALRSFTIDLERVRSELRVPVTAVLNSLNEGAPLEAETAFRLSRDYQREPERVTNALLAGAREHQWSLFNSLNEETLEWQARMRSGTREFTAVEEVVRTAAALPGKIDSSSKLSSYHFAFAVPVAMTEEGRSLFLNFAQRLDAARRERPRDVRVDIRVLASPDELADGVLSDFFEELSRLSSVKVMKLGEPGTLEDLVWFLQRNPTALIYGTDRLPVPEGFEDRGVSVESSPDAALPAVFAISRFLAAEKIREWDASLLGKLAAALPGVLRLSENGRVTITRLVSELAGIMEVNRLIGRMA